MNDKFLKIVLLLIAVSLWILVLQNFDIIKTPKDVYVINTVDVQGSVDVSGSVSVDNTVDVNLDEVLGYRVGCRKSYAIDGRQYNSIDVSVR
ncbi:MAG: hypothetical protein A2V93_01940 [Ignavibacteria bacterium RBG_16_34_14]|nr:MAG: hypothetical protein A2V93_01940 [Ignavibacteria bacterium RBG_16_34_14]